MYSTLTAPVSDWPQLSVDTQPFIPGNANQGCASTMSMAGRDFQSQSNTPVKVDGCSNAEYTAFATDKYLKELQSQHAALYGLAKTVELDHVLRLVELEMKKVVLSLKKQGISSVSYLPAPKGPVVTLTEKLMIVENPEYNLVGRILGPCGMSVKQLEQETGCKIDVRGRGTKKERNEHYNTEQAENTTEEEKPYVVVSCQDTENRVELKLKRAMDELQRILHPTKPKGDEFKRKQLMELAIIKGTYRPPGFFKNVQRMQASQLAMQRQLQPFQGYQVQYAAPPLYPAFSFGGAPMFNTISFDMRQV